MNNGEMKNIRVVELFAGVGGFRLGLERASSHFKTVWANQWEPSRKIQWAYKCYNERFGVNSNHVNKDIATVINEVPEHDLLVGGFPCQDYSVAQTNARGIEGKKGVLWWSILDVIKYRNPSFILLENVDRLVKSPSKQVGRDFGVMLRSLDDAGYNVEWRIINAADYGHIQKRKRIFIFAFKKYSTKYIYSTANQFNILISSGFFANKFPVETKNYNKKNNSLTIKNGYNDLLDISNNFTTNFYNSGTMIDGQILSIETISLKRPNRNLGEIIEKNGVDDTYFINGNSEKYNFFKDSKRLRRINPEGEIYFYSEGKMPFPDELDMPARTLLTTEGSLNRSTHVIRDPETARLRTLTPIECERINGFEDGWTETGMPNRFRYFCMGNALVVPLITEIGQQFLKLWRNIHEH